MRYFATINEEGRIIGRYDTTIHADLPPGAVEISDSDWHLSMQVPGLHRYDQQEQYWLIDPPEVIHVPLETLITEAQLAIDRAAGDARSRYITTVAGQEATYIEKARQAEAYKAAGYPDTPDQVAHIYIVAEKNARGGSTTYRQACDAILVERDQWAVKGAQIEEARRGAKIALSQAISEQDVQDKREAGIIALKAL